MEESWNIPRVTRIFSLYKPALKQVCISDEENTSDKWDIPWCTTRKRCITLITCHSKYSGQHNVQRTMGRLVVIPWNIRRFPVFFLKFKHMLLFPPNAPILIKGDCNTTILTSFIQAHTQTTHQNYTKNELSLHI